MLITTKTHGPNLSMMMSNKYPTPVCVCVCVCVCACVRVCVVLYLGVFRSLLFSDFLAPPKCVMKTEEYTN